jgi:microcystin-dependent protein
VAEPFIGEIRLFGFNFAPAGWAICNGQLLSINQYTALFSLLGTYYGGDGQGTFGLPDLRGRVPLNMGQAPGLSSYSIGDSGGSETLTLSANQLPSHTHALQGSDAQAATGRPARCWAARRRGTSTLRRQATWHLTKVPSRVAAAASR